MFGHFTMPADHDDQLPHEALPHWQSLESPLYIVGVLMHFHIYVTPTHLIEFTTAKSLCALCGVEACRLWRPEQPSGAD
jgi:hypothetical protein